MEGHPLLLSIIVLALITGVLILSNPTITGFVPTPTYTQTLNLRADQSQRFLIKTQLPITSLMLTGSVEGEGLAEVTLSDGQASWLAFSNKKKTGASLSHITGLAVSEIVIEPAETLNTTPTLQSGYLPQQGGFSNACIESCVLPRWTDHKKLHLEISLEPRTTLYLSEITFSVADE